MTSETSKVLIKNGEIIKTLYDNFKAVNIPAVLEQMDPEMSWTEAEGYIYGGTYVGADAILENVFKKLASEWEEFKAEPEKIVDGRDTVVAIGRYSGKYLKTGKSHDVAVRPCLDLQQWQDHEFRAAHGHLGHRETIRFDSIIGWRSKQ